MKKIISVFGTRPEAIKMAPIIQTLEKESEHIQSIVCVTGQHRQMLDQILQVFRILPKYDLDIMRSGQDLFDISTSVLLGLRSVFKEEQPDIVLVHGDTSTSVFAALAAYYMKIPVGHVESGLRTYNRYSPFPEEINRQLTSRMATWHFCPTESSRQNLLAEKIDPSSIFVTGNTVIDALFYADRLLSEDVTVHDYVLNQLEIEIGLTLDTLITSGFILVTGHRRENFGEGIQNLCNALLHIARVYPDLFIVYPVHLNPNVWGPVNQLLKSQANILLTRPMDYLPFILLMKQALIVLTDSGGIQEEAPGFGIPVLVTRDTTERPEAVESGTVRLIGSKSEDIIRHTKELLEDKNIYLQMASSVNPYGDGRAAERIVGVLSDLGTS